jgi:hypothetical protein
VSCASAHYLHSPRGAQHGGFRVPAFGLRLVIVGGFSPHLCFSEEWSSLAASLDFGLTKRTKTTEEGQFQVPSLFCLSVLLLNQPETPLALKGSPSILSTLLFVLEREARRFHIIMSLDK